VLDPAVLKPELFAALIKEDAGMGDVLRNSVRGAYREILDVRAADDARMARTYAVVLDSNPGILITEVFNTRWFWVIRRAVFQSDVFDRRD
jgi:chorismate-pyruvate lyase